MKKLFILLVTLLPVCGNAQTITTFAGNGTAACTGDGLAATAASLGLPYNTAIDATGNVYIVDHDCHCVRKVNTSGIISTVAGNGTAGFSGDGGQATAAQLKYPGGITIDAGGNLYIADAQNNRVRKVDPSGIITTYAGGGTGTVASGDGGPATDAVVGTPVTVHMDAANNLYISHSSRHMRMVNNAGIISKVIGSAVGGSTGDGGPATAASVSFAGGVATDNSSNVYISDNLNHTIRKIDNTGIITTIAGTAGVNGYSGDGGPATNAQLDNPMNLCYDGIGSLYIVDYKNHVIRKLNMSSGFIYTYAGIGSPGYTGDGGLATLAQLSQPTGVKADAIGNIYITDMHNAVIRKITSPTIAAVSNVAAPSSFTITPNPATTELNITASTKIEHLTIANVMGNVVFDKHYYSTNVKIHIANLPVGIYSIKVNDNAVNRFIKQ